VAETPQNRPRRPRELLEEFERALNEQNNPESTGFFARVKDFLETLAEK
jgi:molecular chaperone DnaJ